ncbi:MAG: hypothetical protein ACTSXP_01205 [Promethearchaeota archaeon]
MPDGIFVLLWTPDEGFIVKGRFWQNDDGGYLDSLVIRIAMNHDDDKEFAKIGTPNNTMVISYLTEVKDNKRKKHKIIIGLDVSQGEDPDNFRNILRGISKQVGEVINQDKDEFERNLTAIFVSELGTAPTENIADDLKNKLVEKAKKQISLGKIDDAQEILEMAKSIPSEIEKLVKKGRKMIDQQKIDDAKKCYMDAIELAIKIQENDFATNLRAEFERNANRPKIIAHIQKLEQQAKTALCNEEFQKASELYRTIASESAKINDVDLMQIFTKKSHLCQELHAVHKEYIKKRVF